MASCLMVGLTLALLGPGLASGAESCSSTAGSLMLQARRGLHKHAVSEVVTASMGLWTDDASAFQGGSCEYASASQGGLESPSATSKYLESRAVCLANPAIYGGGVACGSCWKAEREGQGSMVVQIIGSHGGSNNLDCFSDAFRTIAGADGGTFEVRLEPVECEVNGAGPVATIVDGDNAWYTRAIFSNLPHAVLAAWISVDGKATEMRRVSGATWEANLGGGGSVVGFKVSLEGGTEMAFRDCFSSWPVAKGRDDCRDAGCCQQAGQTCYEKDAFFAACRSSCVPGSVNPRDPEEFRTPWTCEIVGNTNPSPTPAPTPSPSPVRPVPSPGPGPSGAFRTSEVGSSKDRLFEFVRVLTNQPVSGSKARAVQSSGGAAGGIVSESQGYGLLLAGTLLAAMDSDSDFGRVSELTYELFLGWRRMCELSAAGGSCQDDEGFQCGGGQYPCLPHWKFGEDLTQVVGKGAAPDGDVDALLGMLLAVLALEGTSREPAWLGEVGQWAYDTCKQFYLSSTVASPSGQHQIVKLGSCWGGWGTQGQNPSYHAPGVYRLCRDYMASHDEKYGGSSTEGDGFARDWETLIATSYKMLAATQCPSTGLVPNWAQIFEDGRRLRAQTGFSGSGTPGAEFGAEASRTIWRVVVDFLLYPSEARPAADFLSPVAKHLGKKENSGRWASSLDVDGACLVETIHPGWQVNMFMAAPTFASLVCPAELEGGRQQELLDSAGRLLASKRIRDYYSGSWVAISTMTLNGDLAKAAANAKIGSAARSASAPVKLIS
ncbi:celCCC [Symbiodinium sp. CCMP2592]|nr:celCCC [Symbiodinium sp. CCMP2592]CAE7830528.1 celCCC [Symbiodinium sp. CCMP2592]